MKAFCDYSRGILFTIIQLFAICAQEAFAQYTLNLQSGNGSIGQPDALVQVQGSATPFMASSGFPLQDAFVVSPFYLWTTAGIAAPWVSPALNTVCLRGGYEYFETFVLPANVASATLGLTWRSDDISAPLLNGNDLAGGQTWGSAENQPGHFAYPTPATFTSDVTALVNPGVNRLSFLVGNADTGGDNPTGLQFTANLTYTVVPEPSIATLLSLTALVAVWRRAILAEGQKTEHLAGPQQTSTPSVAGAVLA
jgi:hypothetical protein